MSEKHVGYLFSAVLLCHMVGIVFFSIVIANTVFIDFDFSKVIML